MSVPPERPWSVIAAEIVSEETPSIVLRLIEELNRALAEQLPKRHANPSAWEDQGSHLSSRKIAAPSTLRRRDCPS